MIKFFCINAKNLPDSGKNGLLFDGGLNIWLYYMKQKSLCIRDVFDDLVLLRFLYFH